MDSLTLVLVLLAFFAAAFQKGITGLGFSSVCLGIVASFIDLKIAIPLVLIPSLSSNVLVMIEAGGLLTAWRRFWLVYLCAIPGVMVGLTVLTSIQSDKAAAVLGLVLIIYGLWALWNIEFRISARVEKLTAAPVGLITGFVNGLTGSQVMPVLPYLFALKLDKNMFVQAINISFTLSSAIMLIGFGAVGLLNLTTAGIGALGIIPVAAGIWLGGRVRRLLPDKHFRIAVLVLLILLGVNLMLGTT